MKKSGTIIFACLMFIFTIGFSYYEHGELSVRSIVSALIGTIVGTLVFYFIENYRKKASHK